MKLVIHSVLLSVILLLSPVAAMGQEADSLSVKKGQTEENPEPAMLQGIGRWSFKFNAVDLLCTVPNLGAEFDLGTDKYSQMSIGLALRYNWNEFSKGYLPDRVFNVFELRPEFRKYQRGLERSKRVLYWGAYLSGGSYSMKFSKTGHQGMMFGAGASAGFVMPLHEFNKFAIDMEIGASLGFCMRSSNAYRLSEDRRSYVDIPEESFGFRPVYWPVVSEIRVAFVFRKVSVRNRYQLTQEQTKALKERKTRKNEQ